MSNYWISLIIALCLALSACVMNSGDEAPTDSLQDIACPDHEIAGNVSCHVLSVLENPDAPEGREIPIRIMVLKATGNSPESDPLFIIPGGPGQSAIQAPNLRRFFAEYFAPIRENRDVVLIDQRGVGASNRLSLEPDAALLFVRPETNIPPEWGRAALPRLNAKADLKQYTTERAVDDLDAVRRALNARHINIYATSYGTRVAQLYIKRYEQRARAVIMKGVSPPDDNIALSYGQKPQRTLDLLFAACASSTRCASAFPNLPAQFASVLEELEQRPKTIETEHPMTGAPLKFEITRGAFAFGVRAQMMNANALARLPYLIARADEGDFSDWAAFLPRLPSVYATQLDGGMTFSIVAAEDAPRLSEALILADADGAFVGETLARAFQEVGAFWPRGDAPKDLFTPLESDVPVLLVSGAFDPATPPQGAEEMLPGLPNARHIVFPGGSHSAANFDGLDLIMAAFIQKGSSTKLDVSAVESNRLPEFQLPEDL